MPPWRGQTRPSAPSPNRIKKIYIKKLELNIPNSNDTN
jgi:hypothetical protein